MLCYTFYRYLRTGVRRGRGRGRGRGADYHERKPPAGYVCHRCGATGITTETLLIQQKNICLELVSLILTLIFFS
jgi:hypothetical protein